MALHNQTRLLLKHSLLQIASPRLLPSLIMPSELRHHNHKIHNLTVPPDAWDVHVHVTDPSRFPPPSTKAEYTPHDATLPSCLSRLHSLGLSNPCFVQTSTYGTDNTWITTCISETPHPARGIIAFDPKTITPAQLRAYHAAGVRGVRVNLVSVSRTLSRAELADELTLYAEKIAPLKTWSLQLYIQLKSVRDLAELVPGLLERGVKVVVDHIGSPPSLELPMERHEGWEQLLRLLGHEGTFVKVSAPYRFTKDVEFRDMEAPVRELFEVRGGDAVVFASDWPHTRFESSDVGPFVERCLEWCDGDRGLAEKLFRTNAEKLLDV